MSEIGNSPETLQIREIEELERQLAEKKAAMNIESGLNQMEIKAEISQENFTESAPNITPVQAPANTVGAQTQNDPKNKEVEQDAKSIAMMDENRKIETLVAIALDKGIMHSIEVATRLQDPYVLDVLHDKLIGELHYRLVKENKLKEL